MKDIKSHIIVILIMAISLGACEIIFEDDISVETIKVIMPSDSLETKQQYQIFWWEQLYGALEYNLQIVEGNFSEPAKLITDTIVTTNKFKTTLLPGNYTWRINAMNAASETGYSCQSLTILDTTKLVKVIL